MKTLRLIKFYFSLISIVLILILSQCCFASETHSKIRANKVIQEGNILVIKVYNSPPETFYKQRQEAFLLTRPHLNKKTEKASVVWQKDEFSNGKMASIANIYIREYLSKKINSKKFTKYFNLEVIEPIPMHKTNVSRIEICPVSIELSRKASELREKGDTYRFVDKYDSAIRIYNQALEYNPYDTIALFWLAEMYNFKGNRKLAEEYYTKVLSIDPNFSAADEALYILKSSNSR